MFTHCLFLFSIPTNHPQKHLIKYNNPHPTSNILYSNLQATFTLPSKHPLKYNKPPQKTPLKSHKKKSKNKKNKKHFAI